MAYSYGSELARTRLNWAKESCSARTENELLTRADDKSVSPTPASHYAPAKHITKPAMGRARERVLQKRWREKLGSNQSPLVARQFSGSALDARHNAQSKASDCGIFVSLRTSWAEQALIQFWRDAANHRRSAALLNGFVLINPSTACLAITRRSPVDRTETCKTML